MNKDKMREKAIRQAAALARGDGLSVIHGICENQKTISTKKVLQHIEQTHDFMKDCAYTMRQLSDALSRLG